MPIEASNRDMDIDMLGIESRTIGGEIPKKLEKMLIQRSTVKRKKDLSVQYRWVPYCRGNHDAIWTQTVKPPVYTQMTPYLMICQF